MPLLLQANRATTFLDELKVQVNGGKGGDGCIAFTKVFGDEWAGPDGGNGGNGGHVIFQSKKGISSLSNIPSIIKAKDGNPGTACNCDGKNGEHNNRWLKYFPAFVCYTVSTLENEYISVNVNFGGQLPWNLDMPNRFTSNDNLPL